MAAVAFRNYLTTTLQLPETQARALMGEGIADFARPKKMKDDLVVRLVDKCRKTFKPAPPVATNACSTWEKARFGIHILKESCTKFRQLAFCCYHLGRTGRNFQAHEATVERLEKLWEWHKSELDIVAPPGTWDPKTYQVGEIGHQVDGSF